MTEPQYHPPIKADADKIDTPGTRIIEGARESLTMAKLQAENGRLRDAINQSNEVFAMALTFEQNPEVRGAMNDQCAANRELVPLTD